MLSGIDVAWRVIIAPNSAFAQIRDNHEEYFAWSVGIFVLGSILWSIAFVILDPAAEEWMGVATDIGGGVLASIVFAVVVYLVGKQLGGARNWRKVFSAVFYTDVLAFPMFAVFMALLLSGDGLLMLALANDQNQLNSGSMEQAQDLMNGVVGFVALFGVIVVVFIAWVIVILVKAVKTVNGFGTAKAFGIIVLAFVVSVVVLIPIST